MRFLIYHRNFQRFPKSDLPFGSSCTLYFHILSPLVSVSDVWHGVWVCVLIVCLSVCVWLGRSPPHAMLIRGCALLPQISFSYFPLPYNRSSKKHHFVISSFRSSKVFQILSKVFQNLSWINRVSPTFVCWLFQGISRFDKKPDFSNAWRWLTKWYFYIFVHIIMFCWNQH